MLISEFRPRGPLGSLDEYVEIANDSETPHRVQSCDGSGGYALAASDGRVRFVIPNGTVIPRRGHFLAGNTTYSLSALAMPDVEFSVDIPDDRGIALFATSDPASFTPENRIDAFGPDSERDALFREGRGFPSEKLHDREQCFYRNQVGGRFEQTDSNADDFRFVVATAPGIGRLSHLGSPGPRNLESPIESNAEITLTLLDATRSGAMAPNYAEQREASKKQIDLLFRRRLTNTSSRSIRALRLRITDLTTWPDADDLRLLSSKAGRVRNADGSAVKTEALVVDAGGRHPFGSGLNSSATIPSVTAANPLLPGASIAIELRFRVVPRGVFRRDQIRWAVNVEALPAAESGPAFTSVLATLRRRGTPGDFNRDGKGDVVWRHEGDGALSLWLMRGANPVTISLPEAAGDEWQIAGIGDFQGDGEADLLWRNSRTGENVAWLMNDGAIAAAATLPTVPSPDWIVAAIGDFQGDGKSDVLWHNRSTGANSLWLMNGAQVAVTARLPTVIGPNWAVAAVGDFQGDGNSDIIWRNVETGANSLWFMSGTSVVTTLSLPTVPPEWFVAGVGDFQADGKSDLIWRDRKTGDNALWFMSGGPSVTVALPSVPKEWEIAAIGDFQGDGKDDILWHNQETGHVSLWLMDGPWNYPFALPRMADTKWHIVPRNGY